MKIAIVLVICVGVWSCGHEIRSAQSLFSDDGRERVFSPVIFDTVWSLGGPQDTILAAPTMPHAYGRRGLVFYDRRNAKVYRVRDDGRIAWAWGTVGEGPGETRNVRAMAVRQTDGAIILVDSGNRRIIELNGDGELISEKPIPIPGTAHSVSVLADGDTPIHHTRQDKFAIWDTSGRFRAVDVPSAIADLLFLQGQGRLASWREDQWVFGFGYGNGWFVARDTSVVGVFPYVEHTVFPDIRHMRRGFSSISQTIGRPVTSGRSVSTRGDTLFVLFGGTKAPGWIIDLYNLHTGRYTKTYGLPHYANRAVVGSDGTIFTVNNSTLFPSIMAVKPSRGEKE